MKELNIPRDRVYSGGFRHCDRSRRDCFQHAEMMTAIYQVQDLKDGRRKAMWNNLHPGSKVSIAGQGEYLIKNVWKMTTPAETRLLSGEDTKRLKRMVLWGRQD